MQNVFFIGDTHFGHKNIIGYNRPEFDNIDEMNEYLIKQWNSVVRPNDIVWHLGDVAMNKKEIYHIGRCNGIKRLVLGNHDLAEMNYYTPYFERIVGCIGYKTAFLTHIPIHTQQFYRVKLNIHGHVHHKDPILTASDRYFNVCADHLNDYTPVCWEDIKSMRKEQLKN